MTSILNVYKNALMADATYALQEKFTTTRKASTIPQP